jgi:tRNA(His) 5'-end guanylyltransferase
MFETVAAGLFAVLMAVLGFFGAKIVQKLDDGVLMLHTVSDQLRENIKEVSEAAHGRINKLDTRIAVIETKCGVFHGTRHSHSRSEDIIPIIEKERI